MRRPISYSLMAIYLIGSLWSSNLWARTSQNSTESKDIILFTDEFEEFIDHAWEIYDNGNTQSAADLEKEVQKLMHNANRIAAAYFETLSADIQAQMESYLSTQYLSNPDIHHYFILIGNSIFERANLLVEQNKAKNKKIRIYSTIGGSLLGLTTGGAVLYFKPNLMPNALHATLFVVGLGAAGAGVGYAGGYAAHRFILPANPDLLNAKDFLVKYPNGQNFVDDWSDASSDISIGLLELEEELAYVGIN